jgi:hypothetical protein
LRAPYALLNLAQRSLGKIPSPLAYCPTDTGRVCKVWVLIRTSDKPTGYVPKATYGKHERADTKRQHQGPLRPSDKGKRQKEALSYSCLIPCPVHLTLASFHERRIGTWLELP